MVMDLPCGNFKGIALLQERKVEDKTAKPEPPPPQKKKTEAIKQIFHRERGNRALVIVLSSRQFLRL